MASRAASFEDLPRPFQGQIAVAGPFMLGMICGLLLDVDATAFWGVQALGVAGGVMGGAEHRNRRLARVRGLVAGVLFTAGILAGHAASGRRPLAKVPHPMVLLVPIGAVAGTLLAMAGAWLASRASFAPGARVVGEQPEVAVEERPSKRLAG